MNDPDIASLGGSRANRVLDRLIVFEGLDGSGKSTQARRLSSYLVGSCLTSEPTHDATGLLIRDVLRGVREVTTDSLAWLFAADRFEHLYGKDSIVSHLDSGEIVICDRYIFSSLAYQVSYVRDSGISLALNASFPLPGLLVYLDIPPIFSLQRIEARGDTPEMFDRIDTLIAIHRAYDEVLARYEGSGMEILRVDATKMPDDVFEDIRIGVASYLKGIEEAP